MNTQDNSDVITGTNLNTPHSNGSQRILDCIEECSHQNKGCAYQLGHYDSDMMVQQQSKDSAHREDLIAYLTVAFMVTNKSKCWVIDKPFHSTAEYLTAGYCTSEDDYTYNLIVKPVTVNPNTNVIFHVPVWMLSVLKDAGVRVFSHQDVSSVKLPAKSNYEFTTITQIERLILRKV